MNPLRPVVCLDETSRQLIGEKILPIPTAPGHPMRYDYEYIRNGVVNIFMMFEPLAARRYISVTDTRTRTDFAHLLYDLSEKYYPHAEKIILVMDNLNIHSLASLYEAVEPQEARRLHERFEVHHTPVHASWLNMAEIEIGVMVRQCLDKRIPTKAQMTHDLYTWMSLRNSASLSVKWHFTTHDARIKLKSLYPKF